MGNLSEMLHEITPSQQLRFTFLHSRATAAEPVFDGSWPNFTVPGDWERLSAYESSARIYNILKV
jgi:hypothetical protein